MFNNSDIKCFLTLAKTLSFTKTGQILFMSQQAVSQRISKLEKDIGLMLFIRSRNYVKLTKAGEKIYSFLSAVRDSYKSLIAECLNDVAQMSKSLRVGYQNMLDWGPILNTAQDALYAENPGIEIIGELFDSSVLIEHLIQRRVNMIVVYDRFVPKLSGIEKMELLTIPLMVMVSAKHPSATADATYKTFAHEPFIEDVFGNEESADTLKRAWKTANICNLSPSEIVVVPNRDSVNMAAESGRGIIVGTPLSFAYKSSGLRCYPTEAKETLVCIWNEDEENLLVRKYAKCLQNVYKTYSY